MASSRGAPVPMRGRCQLQVRRSTRASAFIGWKPPRPASLVRHAGPWSVPRQRGGAGRQRRIDPVALPPPKPFNVPWSRRRHRLSSAQSGTELSATPRGTTARASCGQARWGEPPPARSTSAASGVVGRLTDHRNPNGPLDIRFHPVGAVADRRRRKATRLDRLAQCRHEMGPNATG